jgi:phosphoglycolate phosphatase-like HAD superfamily hydrolase
MLGEVRPFDGVRDLLADVADRGLTVVLASSGAPDHVQSTVALHGGLRRVPGCHTPNRRSPE